MKLILGISIAFSIFLSHGEAATCKESSVLKICHESNIITQMLLMPEEKYVASMSARRIWDLVKLMSDGEYDYHSPSVTIRSPDADDDSPERLRIFFSRVQFSNETRLPLSKLSTLTLNDNGLTEVPTDLFLNVDLRKLEITDNPITVIHANAFSPLKNLSSLILDSNNITTLEPGCFNGLEQLKHLELRLNQLILRPGIFSSLKALHSLEIIDSVAAGGFHAQAFKGFPNLYRLLIFHGHEITLEPGMFDDNPKLASLGVDVSKFRHIPRNIFNNLPSLDFLSLRNDVIESIEPGAFPRHINSLILHNGYKGGIIHPGIFIIGSQYDLAEDLILAGNEIFEIRPRAFEGLGVRYLDLSDNNITKIAAETFTGVAANKVILSRNPIVHIEPDAFKNATIGSLIVDSDSIIAQNRSYWGIPDSISIKGD